MKLVLLSILIGIVLPTSSSFTNSSSVKRNSQEIPNPPLKGILKKSGTINTTREKSDLRVRFSSTCKWGGLSLQQLRELTNSSVRMLLEGEIEGITDTDCMLVYRVDNKDGGRPFYPFRIDRQVAYSGIRGLQYTQPIRSYCSEKIF
ncbi:hypothetical protein GCK32_013638 [Trichostrongylus colubriformis]|uniref:Uncharacterized protein n=1 Tax=Trichostrongylus colubriformis TaxID=6319 RepID=A0AAN8IQI5_TRICO